VFVQRQAVQPQLEQRGDRLDAVVGQLLGQHHVARPGERRHGQQHAVLRPCRDHDLVGRGGESRLAHPERPGGTVFGPAQAHVVGQEAPELTVRADLRDGLGHEPLVRVAGRQVEGQVDEAAFRLVLGRQGHVDRHPLAHEGAAADLARDQAAALRLAIGAGHGTHRDAEPPGQVPVGRQALAGRQTALADVLGQGLGDRDVTRAAVPLEGGLPSCHGDNVAVDGDNVQGLSLLPYIQSNITVTIRSVRCIQSLGSPVCTTD
jgi:hypothetical protein